jgi:hypothetical protein
MATIVFDARLSAPWPSSRIPKKPAASQRTLMVIARPITTRPKAAAIRIVERRTPTRSIQPPIHGIVAAATSDAAEYTVEIAERLTSSSSISGSTKTDTPAVCP